MRPRLLCSFFQIKEPKGEIWIDYYYKTTFDTCFTQMGKKGIRTYGKRLLVDMLDEYEKCTTRIF